LWKIATIAKITQFHYLDGKILFCIFLDMEKQIIWTVAAISEFAKAKALSAKQAFNYLSLFKGLDFCRTIMAWNTCSLLKIRSMT